MDIFSILIVAFLVGILIGMTGMGGGSLMTPALIFLGIPPTVAVSNDLVAAAFSKSAGAITHWKKGSPNMQLVLWLVLGSVPFALAGGFIIDAIGSTTVQDQFVKIAVGSALLLAAATYTLRVVIAKHQKKPLIQRKPKIRPIPTLLIGAIGGLLVGLTSVGSGTLMMVALLLLYPTMKASGLVGTDLVQAVPLIIAAAIGHVVTGGVQFDILLPLIIGSVPGTILGANLASKVKQQVVRRLIVAILLLAGLAMLGVPMVVTLAVGLLALIFGPILLETTTSTIKKRRRNETNDQF